MLKMIAALDNNGGIGKQNELLFFLKEDMAYFKEVTMGYPIIMGYNTWLSIGKPLAGRENLILTTKDIEIPGTKVFHTKEEILSYLGDRDAFVIGGEKAYNLFMDDAKELYITIIKEKDERADCFFPKIPADKWKIESCKEVRCSCGIDCSFLVYKKKEE